MAYRYNGSGDHLLGIPARDLTDEEAAALSDEDRAAVESSGLYQATTAKATSKRGAQAPEEG